MARESSRAARTTSRSLGIKRGDRVMLVLKRHYQFWFAILAPAQDRRGGHPRHEPAAGRTTSTYRFEAAGVKRHHLHCADEDIAARRRRPRRRIRPALETHASSAARARAGTTSTRNSPPVQRSIRTRGRTRPAATTACSCSSPPAPRATPRSPSHSYKYPLGHFITAKYWHCVDPDGLHLTISDTGWAKAHVGQALRPVAVRGGGVRLRLRPLRCRGHPAHVRQIPHHHLLRAADDVPHDDQGGPVQIRPVAASSMPPLPARR